MIISFDDNEKWDRLVVHECKLLYMVLYLTAWIFACVPVGIFILTMVGIFITLARKLNAIGLLRI